MLHLADACLISGLCWTILGYVSAMLGSCWTISVYFVVLLAFVGHEFGPHWPYPGPLWAMVAPYWGHVEPFWAILGAVLSMQGVCKKHCKYQQKISKNTLFGLAADGLCSLFWVMFVSLLWELFCPCKAFAKNTVNTSKKYTFWPRCWWSLLPLLGYVCFFSFGVCCT